LNSGNHETPGTWRQGALEDDMVDLTVVVEYLKATYGYVIDLVVGHSRGSLVGMRWVCTSEDGKNISGFVNASGRYRMRVSIFRKRLLFGSSDLTSPGC
jgi:alpha-beta hydrolase superfamily lysophospholipase